MRRHGTVAFWSELGLIACADRRIAAGAGAAGVADAAREVGTGKLSNGIYLELEVGAAAARQLNAVLATIHVDCVLLRPIAGETIDIAAARDLVQIGQRRNAAVLVAGNTRLAIKLGADGAHLDWTASAHEDFAIARETLASGCVVGVDAGQSRHDAMTLAEAGADYIGFRPEETRREERVLAAHQARFEMVEWWAEVTQVPCVAFEVQSPEEARRLLAVSADFIGIWVGAGETAADAAERVGAIAAAAKAGPSSSAGG